jgi:acyl carrier protein
MSREDSRGSPPTEGIEMLITRVWQEVLQRNHVDPDEDFVLLGGHSLAAVQIARLIERDTGVRIPVELVFDASTLRAFIRAASRLIAITHDGAEGELGA